MATARDPLAFDRASVRRIDGDGHLFIEVSPISKANVCGYRGGEIPDHETLGLDPARLYQLFRDPAELEKAAPSFRGKPVLSMHRPVTADDHPHKIVVGSIGQDVRFDPPYLKASLSIWDAVGVEGIENGEQRELSAAYRYRADMTPGTYNGTSYDGVMRDIRANHVALVAAGRAGSDVVVGDAQPGVPAKATQAASRKFAGRIDDGARPGPGKFASGGARFAPIHSAANARSVSATLRP